MDSKISPVFSSLNGPLKLPKSVADPGILVGWSMEMEHARHPIGFSFGDTPGVIAPDVIDPILLEDEGHLITVAPTGAGKGVSAIIPTLLRYKGPIIVIDPKGENVAVTARARKEMGHKVIVIDPMNITDFDSDSFNPLAEINPLMMGATEQIGNILTSLFSSHKSTGDNYFWKSQGQLLVRMCILHVLSTDKHEKTLAEVRDTLLQVMDVKGILNTKLPSSNNQEVRNYFLNLPSEADSTWQGIVSFALDGLAFVNGPEVNEVLNQSTFTLEEVTRGEPISIYIVVPPALLETLSPLLRLWISCLFQAISRRKRRPELATLFILDEAAQLGELPQLRQAMTLMRGYGLRTWSFWQDMSQLQSNYKNDWQTMINNAKVFQAFGANNVMAARSISEVVGFTSEKGRELIDLDTDEMILQIAGDEAVIARKPNYLTDPVFEGLYDENPLYETSGNVMPDVGKIHSFYKRPSRNSVQESLNEIGVDFDRRQSISRKIANALHKHNKDS